jgi:H+-transporting ATPase
MVTRAHDISACGLTSQAAQEELQKVGPNSMPDTAESPWARIMAKLWAPVPWMLEAAIVLQLSLHKWVEAAVIAALLTFNAAIGYFQEGKAQATLAALKSRLGLDASVERDGV